TKLFALGLFTLNGQWDGFVETVAAAAVHTLAALLLVLLGRRWLHGTGLALYAALLVLLFTLPFSWENSIFGFQSTFYFLLLFSLGHIWLSLERDRFGVRWMLGQVSGVLAVLSMASGFFSSLAILAVLGHRFARERRWSVQQGTTAGLAVGLSVVGWLMKNEVPGHAPLHAHGLGQFTLALLELVAWPGSALFPWSLVLFAPALWFILRRTRSRTTSPDDAILLGLLAWLVLQCLATAYARGGSGAVLSPRYLDLLAVNVALGLLFLLREFSGRPRPWLAALWLAAVVAGLAQQSRAKWHDFVAPNIPRQQRQEANVRAYLRTGDSAHLLNQPWGEVPYPVGEVLLQRLSFPVIQAIMPPSVRRSVSVSNGAPDRIPAGVPAAQRPVALSTWSGTPATPPVPWRSATQSAGALPILRFWIAGDLDPSGRAGRLVVKSAAGAVPVVPESASGTRWKSVNVFRPAGEWWLEAEGTANGAWFAFTEPVEVGRWTWVAEKLLKLHFTVMLVGAGMLAAGGWLARRRADERVA
ncbi:MAG: hypothetical protein WCL24_11200, partial [Verrucomicrobiota bacterium]